MNKLTTKQRLFVEAYLTNPNGVQAARKAGYKGNDKTLSVVAAENLRKPCIAEHIERRVEKAIITTDEVLTDVKDIAKTAERDADRLKGYELLGKYLAMWTDRTVTDGKQIVEVVFTKE